MPTYEYECETCGHRFEMFQSMNDKRLTRCKKDICPSGGGKGKVKRLLGTGAGLIFKGSGFYETDYRSESYKKGAESAASAEKSASSDSGGSDKKKEKKETKKTDSGSGGGSTKPAATSKPAAPKKNKKS